jgi:hypothetical protein
MSPQCVDSDFGERSLRFIKGEPSELMQIGKQGGINRREFLGRAIAGGATILAGASFGLEKDRNVGRAWLSAVVRIAVTGAALASAAITI